MTSENSDTLMRQALDTYNKITRRLEEAVRLKGKMPPRASRTTAYAAFQTRINQLESLQKAAHRRYLRRKKFAIN